MPWIDALAAILRGVVANVSGDRDAANIALREAITLAQAADMQLYAAASRHQLGVLLGGTEGKGLVERAEDAMAAQEIRAPARFAAMLVPIAGVPAAAVASEAPRR
jgi:eukaryotic-like serine/threonine-protein kinase